MIEIWSVIPGFSDYDVSDMGHVQSRRVSAEGRPVAQIQRSAGRYNGVAIINDAGEPKRVMVHALVLLAFVGPRPAGMVSRHLDDDPVNNKLSNLAYGTMKDNMADKLRNGHNTNANKTHCKRGHEFTEENIIRLPNGNRHCRACQDLRYQASYAKQKVINAQRLSERGPLPLATHCKYGHEFTVENTIRYGIRGQKCRICARRRNTEYQERLRAKRTHPQG